MKIEKSKTKAKKYRCENCNKIVKGKELVITDNKGYFIKNKTKKVCQRCYDDYYQALDIASIT